MLFRACERWLTEPGIDYCGKLRRLMVSALAVRSYCEQQQQ
jgi:hypothetical protein